MGSNWRSQVAQQSSRPHVPTPPIRPASSRTPIWRSSIRVRKMDARSLTRSRKSTRFSAVKKKVMRFPSNWYSTSTSFMSTSRWTIRSFAVSYARVSFERFRSKTSMSSGCAGRRSSRSFAGASSRFTHSLVWWTFPRSMPRSACTGISRGFVKYSRRRPLNTTSIRSLMELCLVHAVLGGSYRVGNRDVGLNRLGDLLEIAHAPCERTHRERTCVHGDSPSQVLVHKLRLLAHQNEPEHVPVIVESQGDRGQESGAVPVQSSFPERPQHRGLLGIHQEIQRRRAELREIAGIQRALAGDVHRRLEMLERFAQASIGGRRGEPRHLLRHAARLEHRRDPIRGKRTEPHVE